MNAKKYVPNRLRGVFNRDKTEDSMSPSTISSSSSSRVKGKKSRPWRVDAASWKQQLQERKAVYDDFALKEKADEEKDSSSQAPTEKGIEGVPFNLLTSTTTGGDGQVDTILTPKGSGKVETVFTLASKVSSTCVTNSSMSAPVSPVNEHSLHLTSPLPDNSYNNREEKNSQYKSADSSSHRMERIEGSDKNNCSCNDDNSKNADGINAKKLMASRSVDSWDSNEYFIDIAELLSAKSKDSNVRIVNGVPHIEKRAQMDGVFRPQNKAFKPEGKCGILRHGDSDETLESIGFPYGEGGGELSLNSSVNKASIMEVVEDFIDPIGLKYASESQKDCAKSNLHRPHANQIDEITCAHEADIGPKKEISASRRPIFGQIGVDADADAVIRESTNRQIGHRRQRVSSNVASQRSMPQLALATSLTSTIGKITGDGASKDIIFRGQKQAYNFNDNHFDTKLNNTIESSSQDDSRTTDVSCGGGDDDGWSIRPIPSDEDVCLERQRFQLREDVGTKTTSFGNPDIHTAMNDVLNPLTQRSTNRHKEIENDITNYNHDMREGVNNTLFRDEIVSSMLSESNRQGDIPGSGTVKEKSPTRENHDTRAIALNEPMAVTPDPLQKARKTLLLSNLNRSVRSLQDATKDVEIIGEASSGSSFSTSIFVPLRPCHQSTKEFPFNVLDNHGVYLSKYNKNGIFIPPNNAPVQCSMHNTQKDNARDMYNEHGAYVPQDRAATLVAGISEDHKVAKGKNQYAKKYSPNECISSTSYDDTKKDAIIGRSEKLENIQSEADVKEEYIETSETTEILQNNQKFSYAEDVQNDRATTLNGNTPEEHNVEGGGNLPSGKFDRDKFIVIIPLEITKNDTLLSSSQKISVIESEADVKEDYINRREIIDIFQNNEEISISTLMKQERKLVEVSENIDDGKDSEGKSAAQDQSQSFLLRLNEDNFDLQRDDMSCVKNSSSKSDKISDADEKKMKEMQRNSFQTFDTLAERSNKHNDSGDRDDDYAVDEIDANRIRLVSDLKIRVSSLYTGNHICVESIGTSEDPDPLGTARRKRATIKATLSLDLEAQLNYTVSSLNTDHHHIIESPGKLKSVKGKKWKERMAMRKMSKKSNIDFKNEESWKLCPEESTYGDVTFAREEPLNDIKLGDIKCRTEESCVERSNEGLKETDDSGRTLPPGMIEKLKIEIVTPLADDNISDSQDYCDDAAHDSSDKLQAPRNQDTIKNLEERETIFSAAPIFCSNASLSVHEPPGKIKTSIQSEPKDIVPSALNTSVETTGAEMTDADTTNNGHDLPEDVLNANNTPIETDPKAIRVSPDIKRCTIYNADVLRKEVMSVHNSYVTKKTEDKILDTFQAHNAYNVSDEPKFVNIISNVSNSNEIICTTLDMGTEHINAEQGLSKKPSESVKSTSEKCTKVNPCSTDNESNIADSKHETQSHQNVACSSSILEVTTDTNILLIDQSGNAATSAISDEGQPNSTNNNNIIQGLPPNKSKKWKDRLKKKKNKKSEKTGTLIKENSIIDVGYSKGIKHSTTEHTQETNPVDPFHSNDEDSTNSKDSKDRPSFKRNLSDLTAEEKLRETSPTNEAQTEPDPKVFGKKSNKWKNRLAKIKGSKQENAKSELVDVKPKLPSTNSDRGQILVDFKSPDMIPIVKSEQLSSTPDRGQILVDFKRLHVPPPIKPEILSGLSGRGQILVDFKTSNMPLSEVTEPKIQEHKEGPKPLKDFQETELSNPNKTSPQLVPFDISRDKSKTQSPSQDELKIQDSKIHQNLRQSFDVFDAFLQNGQTTQIDDESIYTEMTIGQESMLESGLPVAQRSEEELSYTDFTLEDGIHPSFVEQNAASKTTPKDKMKSSFIPNTISSMFQEKTTSISKISIQKNQAQEHGKEGKVNDSPGKNLKKFPTITVGDDFDDEMTQITMGSLDENQNENGNEEFFDAESKPFPVSPSSKSVGKKNKWSTNSRNSLSASSHSSQVSCSEASKQRIVEILRKEVWSRDNNVVRKAMEELYIEAKNGQNHRAHIVRCGGVMTIMRAMEMNYNCEAIQIASCLTLEKLALDPQTQTTVCEMEGTSLIVRSMQVHFENVQLQKAACVALATICRQQETSTSKDSMKDAEEAVPTLLSCMTRYQTNTCIQAKGFQAIANLCSGNHACQRLEELSKAGGIMTLTMALQTPWENKNDQHEAISNLSILLRGITELNEKSSSTPTRDEISKNVKGDEISVNRIEQHISHEDISNRKQFTDNDTVNSCIEEIPDMPMMSTTPIHSEEIPDLDHYQTVMSNLEWQNFGEDDLDAGRKASTGRISPSIAGEQRQGEEGRKREGEEQCTIQ